MNFVVVVGDDWQGINRFAGSDILRPRSRVNRSARSSLNDFFDLKNDESDASVGHALRVPLPNRDETDRTLPAARTLPAPPRAAATGR